VEPLYRRLGETARQEHLLEYERLAREQAGEGAVVVLTGRGPIYYLRLVHALHGVARRLTYRAPEAGEVHIFCHTSR
jgi:hypothetical protein